MKNSSVTIRVKKEESEEKFLDNETKEKTEEFGILSFFQFLGFLYCLWFTIYLKSNDERFGQKTPVYINSNYIAPYGYMYVLAFSILAIIPSASLYFMGTTRDTPFNFQKSVVFLVIANGLYTFNNINGIYSIMGPIYYLKYRYEIGTIETNEAIIAAIYIFAFIIGSKFIFGFMREAYKCFLDMVNLWKRLKLQLRPQQVQPDTLV